MVGDYDQSNFKTLMQNGCPDENGCGFTPESFNFNWTNGNPPIASMANGTVTMEGNVDADETVLQTLIDVVDKALLASSSCVQATAWVPGPTTRKRANVGNIP